MKTLKKLSISLVLLSCFAVTSKIGAMDPNEQRRYAPMSQEALNQQYTPPYYNKKLEIVKLFYRSNIDETSHMEKIQKNQRKLEVIKNVARTSREGVQEKDMKWIIEALETGFLSINALNHLIRFGLKKHVNYLLDEASEKLLGFHYDTNSILKAAIKNYDLEAVKLLVSIRAEIDEEALKIADKEAKNHEEQAKSHPDIIFSFRKPSIEIKSFLFTEKEKIEKEKAKICQNLMAEKAKKFSDTRINFTN